MQTHHAVPTPGHSPLNGTMESRGAGSSPDTNSSVGTASCAVAVAFSDFINVHPKSLNGNVDASMMHMAYEQVWAHTLRPNVDECCQIEAQAQAPHWNVPFITFPMTKLTQSHHRSSRKFTSTCKHIMPFLHPDIVHSMELWKAEVLDLPPTQTPLLALHHPQWQWPSAISSMFIQNRWMAM